MCATKNEMKNIKLDRIINLFNAFPETIINCCGDSKTANLEWDLSLIKSTPTTPVRRNLDVKKPTEVGSFTRVADQS